MNKVIKCLTERKSCKKFKSEQIKPEELELILKAGTCAPSGKGLQSPIILVLQDAKTIKKLSKLNTSILGAKVDPFYNAPTVLVVLGDKRIWTYVEDASLVLGNLMNAAYSLGVGSCWIHRAKEEFETEQGKKMLKKWGVDENYVGVGHCVLGYPDGPLHPPIKRKGDFVRFVK